MKFHYKAYNKTNNLIESELEAADESQARSFLTQQGLEVLALQEIQPLRRSQKRWSLLTFGSVSLEQKMLFTKHLSLMLKSGMPVNEAIAVLVTESRGYFRAVLRKILTSIEGGNHLMDSLAMFPRIFNRFYLSMVQIGEESGTLEQSLINLAEHLRKSHDLKNKIRAALLYPLIIVTAMVGLGFTLSIFVLPKLVTLFASLGSQLPLTTKILLWFSSFISGNWRGVIIWFVVIVIVILVSRQLYVVKRLFHWLALRSPLIGRFSHTLNIASICRSLSLLLACGITLDKALEIIGSNIYNVYYQDDIKYFLEQVKRGESLGETMKSRHSRFPVIVSRMIRVGEQSGNLADTLQYLADFYEDDLDNLSKNLSAVLEPILLVVIGGIVGFVALAIISPIYNFTDNVSR